MGRSVHSILAHAAPLEPEVPEELDEALVDKARHMGWRHVLYGKLDEAAVHEDFLDGPRRSKDRDSFSSPTDPDVALEGEEDDNSAEPNCPIHPESSAEEAGLPLSSPSEPLSAPTEPLSPSSGIFHPQTLDGALDLPVLPAQRRRSPLMEPPMTSVFTHANSPQPIEFRSPPAPRVERRRQSDAASRQQ